MMISMNDVKELLRPLAAIYPSVIASSDAVGVWQRVLQNCSRQEVERAIFNYLSEDNFRSPTPGAIKARVVSKPVDDGGDIGAVAASRLREGLVFVRVANALGLKIYRWMRPEAARGPVGRKNLGSVTVDVYDEK